MIILVQQISEGKRKSQPDTISWLFKPLFDALEWIGRLVCRAITVRLPIINLPVAPMSTKDYEKIAEPFRIYRPTDPIQLDLYMRLLYRMMHVLKKDNPRFNDQLFMRLVEA